MPHFFISYAKKDTRELALALNSALNAIPNVSSWTDQSLQIGKSWELQIQKEINRCDYMIVLYSPDINRHKHNEDESYVLTEIAYAKYTLKKTIIPVMAQVTEPPMSLTTTQYIDFTIAGTTLIDLIAKLCDEAGIERIFSTKQLEEKLQQIHSFSGKQNSDWTTVIQTVRTKGITFELCLVPPGKFYMGNDKHSDEKPLHAQVITRPYWISRYPITNIQWRQAVEYSGNLTAPNQARWYNDPDKAHHPVIGLTWNQCLAFTRWLGHSYKLPSEVEWEYAARGLDSLVYPWGNDWQSDRVIYQETSNGTTAAIDGRIMGASWIGAHDMIGNVLEYTRSIYRPYPYLAEDGRENNSDGFSERVTRGGAWDSGKEYAYSSHRVHHRYGAFFTTMSIGFRIVLSPWYPNLRQGIDL